MIVVVAGQCRKAGKTRAVCDLIAATREAGWVAVKLTSHEHAPDPGADNDTGRYLAAGAVEAHLLAGLPLPEGANLVIESNSILDHVEPDLVFLVTDPDRSEWKDSAVRHRARSIIVERRLLPEHIDELRRRLSESRA